MILFSVFFIIGFCHFVLLDEVVLWCWVSFIPLFLHVFRLLTATDGGAVVVELPQMPGDNFRSARSAR